MKRPSSGYEGQLLQTYVEEFELISGLRPNFDPEYLAEITKLVSYLAARSLRSLPERRREFFRYANYKFRLSAKPIAKFYAKAAALGYSFNYHQKRLIQYAFDSGCSEPLLGILHQLALPAAEVTALMHLYMPVGEGETLKHLRSECIRPSKLRKEKGDREIGNEIVKAQFSAFLWVSLPEEEMHRYFDPHYSEAEYHESFWQQLHMRSPGLFNRENALHVVRFNRQVINIFSDSYELRGAISNLIGRLYQVINNHGYLAIILEPIEINDRCVAWELAADITLYAEKHLEYPLNKMYFQWQRVRQETLAHIPSLQDAARFDLVNEGFTYRDCFVLASKEGDIERLLLIFQKNERNETPIPCPTCRSANVQGNSYSSLGVRSWECNNRLCPDRSKYNRGKRYSFRSLAMQQAIEEDRNTIPVSNVRRWLRDVVTDVNDEEIMEMLIRHYSMFGDTVCVYNWPEFTGKPWGRTIKHRAIALESSHSAFWRGPFFERYISPSTKSAVVGKNLGDDEFQVLSGDAAEILRGLADARFDAAVTSPPYFNAREYAQWPNMYCYLHDMYDINHQVFRTLKPGALYLYNVFDYFDNENTVVFSAMGQRRMILSAYTVDLFRRIGFELLGNVVWDKGDIEGKRGFNAGNFSPFYQSPFNCWEHVLIFRKPVGTEPGVSVAPSIGLRSRVLNAQPVIKIVNGQNIHGHPAPFPEAIPELIISRLPPDATVLDPFGGSLTTGRVAQRYGIRSVCIELLDEYCRLGLRMKDQYTRQLTIF